MKIQRISYNFIPPTAGNLLISEPFLEDPCFRRSVVLLAEHNVEGSVGFVMNRLMNIRTDDLFPKVFTHNYPVFYGGPVEPNTLHFIFKCQHQLPNALHIYRDLYWGGEAYTINQLLLDGIIDENQIRFFVGYSGWAPYQLDEELKQQAWYTTLPKSDDVLFSDNVDAMWGQIVKSLGKDFEHLATPPEDPRWN
jgi:putative transcriptional regulator